MPRLQYHNRNVRAQHVEEAAGFSGQKSASSISLLEQTSSLKYFFSCHSLLQLYYVLISCSIENVISACWYLINRFIQFNTLRKY